MLFRDTGAAVPAVASSLLTTLREQRTVRVASLGPLRAGRAAIPRLPAAMMPLPAGQRAEDGLLPTSLFDGVCFDNRAGRVVLNPRHASRPAVP